MHPIETRKLFNVKLYIQSSVCMLYADVYFSMLLSLKMFIKNVVRNYLDNIRKVVIEIVLIFMPTCELGFNAFENELHKSFSKGVCVENHAFHTKPVW